MHVHFRVVGWSLPCRFKNFAFASIILDGLFPVFQFVARNERHHLLRSSLWWAEFWPLPDGCLFSIEWPPTSSPYITHRSYVSHMHIPILALTIQYCCNFNHEIIVCIVTRSCWGQHWDQSWPQQDYVTTILFIDQLRYLLLGNQLIAWELNPLISSTGKASLNCCDICNSNLTEMTLVSIPFCNRTQMQPPPPDSVL